MSEPLAEARVLIVPDLTKFSAELKTQLAAQVAAVEGSTVALAAKTKTTRTAAVAEEQLAGGVISTAEALRIEQREAAKSAAAHAQLARGASATTLSLLGVRGATLAAGSQFLIGAAAITLLAKSIKGAIEDEETLFGVTKVLGSQIGQKLAADANTLADSFGITNDQALKFEGALAATLRNAGVTGDKIVELSERFVRLAADLAAVRHVPVEQTLKGIQLAVSGNTRSLRQYGIVIQNAEVQQQALAQTGKETTDELTRQELTAARVSLIFQRASFAAGGFAANSGSLANKAKILNANLDALGDSIGGALIPALSETTGEMVKVIKAFKTGFDAVNDFFEGSRNFSDKIGGFLGFGDKAAENLDKAGHSTTALEGLLGGLGGALDEAAAAFNRLANSAGAITFNTAIAQIAALEEHLTQLDIVGASSAAKIAAQQAVADAAQRAVRSATTVAGRREARERRRQAVDEIRNIQAADKAAAEAAANAAKSAAARAKAAAEAAARAAQEALDAQDAALAFAQQFAQGQLSIAAEKAKSTKSLADDVQVLQSQLALTTRQIVEAAQIHDAQTRLNTIQQLQLQAVTLQNQIDDQIEQQRQARRQRKLDALNSAVELARLDVQIFEARHGGTDLTAAGRNTEIALLLKENVALEKTRQAWKGNTQKQKEITLEIERNNAQIRELRKQKQENAGLSAALQFQFLQTQTGFVANLLGNLIPTSAVAGTVGGATGGAISTPTIDPFGAGGFSTAAHQRNFTGGVSTAARVNAGVRGASAGQMSTLIGINRDMLNVLLRLAGQRSAPEANREWQWTSADLTGTWGN